MKRVAIDIDEVLVSFVKPMAKFRGYKIPTAQKYPYVYKDMFDITETQSRNMVHDFYESEEFAKLKPIPGVCKQMGYLRKHADTMYIVTGRQSYARDQTEKWLEYWFPNTFDDLIMTNSYTDHEIEKHEICRSLALDSIIDDSFDVCTKCNRIGIDAYNIIGYGKIRYPWAIQSNMQRVWG
jgi:hypothetical protein